MPNPGKGIESIHSIDAPRYELISETGKRPSRDVDVNVIREQKFLVKGCSQSVSHWVSQSRDSH